MLKYIFNRIIAMAITLFIILTIAFIVVRLMPGNVYDNMDLPPPVVLALEAKAHLDKPLIVQYGYFLKGVVLEGDWGTSVKLEPSVPVMAVLKRKIPISLLINIVSLAISLPIGIAAGAWAALKKNQRTDYVISFLVVIFISVPSFVFASLLQYVLAFKFNLFPIVYEATATGWMRFYSMTLPVLALAFGPIATVVRYLRGELLETLNSEFMLLARTKGLTQVQATVRHAFRNSCLPLTNIMIPMFTNILGGSLVIERIFSIPGVGSVMIDSVNVNDHPLTIAVLIFYSVVSLLTILIVDVSYGIIDPRIRLGGEKRGKIAKS